MGPKSEAAMKDEKVVLEEDKEGLKEEEKKEQMIMEKEGLEETFGQKSKRGREGEDSRKEEAMRK